MRQGPTMVGDNGLCLSMTRVCDHGPQGWGLCACQIAIAQSIVTLLQSPGRESTSVALD